MMEQMQSMPQGQVLPHIVQVYEPAAAGAAADGKLHNSQIIHISHPTLHATQANLTYQTITSQPLSIPVSSHHHVTVAQNMQNQQMQTLQSCQEITLQNHQNLQSLSLHGQELQITQHVILPPVFKQHMVLNGVPGQYYGQYDGMYQKDEGRSHCVVAKLEPDVCLVVEAKPTEYQPERADVQNSLASKETTPRPLKKRRNRSPVPNPGQWACNIRKQKHQRGEAYISRRGKFVPPKTVRNTKDCFKSCKFKCATVITDVDREHLFKAFYSLSANEKKHFLLNTTERCSIKHSKKDGENQKRKYSFKYFFLVRAVRYTVCKNFYLGTLSISQKPVYNVHLGKSDWNIPKPDGRGTNKASVHSLPSECKDRVRKHIIRSFNTIESKPLVQFSQKKQYISGNLTIKQMYKMHQDECKQDGVECVKESMYRKIIKKEFNVHFKRVNIKVEHQLCSKCKEPVKKK